MGCFSVYVLYVIDPNVSEVIGVYTNIDRAIRQLLKSAGYIEKQSTQQLYQPQFSFELTAVHKTEIYQTLRTEMELKDEDTIYRIERKVLELEF